MPQQARDLAKKLVRLYFKDDKGDPFEMTDGQADIFLVIFTKAHPRNQVIASTQYGKSEVVAMALILRSHIFGEKWAIVSGSTDKAMIIMGKVIQHIFDHPRFYKAIEYDPNFPLDRLKRERSKEKIDWVGGGGIQIFTANSKNQNMVKESLTGFGAPNIVEDEASLIPNELQTMVLRMLGGHKDNFLLKIGNPFYRNHFLKTWNSPKYFKIFIDYKQALAEGRYGEDFIEEMRKEPFFDVLYECKFPDASEILPDGYRQLISEAVLHKAFITEEEFREKYCTQPIKDEDDNVIGHRPPGRPKLGADFAGAGRDRSSYVIRWDRVMRLLSTNNVSDTMQQVRYTQDYIEEYDIEPSDAGLDYGGLGQGISDRLWELDVMVNKVLFGQSAPDEVKHIYLNMRAYLYYTFKQWIADGGKIVANDGFLELLSVNYRENSEKKFQIQPKEDLKKIMKKMGITASSPDVADSGALTFANNYDMADADDIDLL